MCSQTRDDDDVPTAPIHLQPRARVLLAEDDTSFRSLVARRLDRDGFDVYEAGSGDEALRMLLLGWPSDEFELVILDHHMPGSTGLDVLSRLREEHDATPALIMTAFPDPELSEHARRCGAAVLVKPFSLDKLCDATIDAILAARSTFEGAGGT